MRLLRKQIPFRSMAARLDSTPKALRRDKYAKKGTFEETGDEIQKRYQHPEDPQTVPSTRFGVRPTDTGVSFACTIRRFAGIARH